MPDLTITTEQLTRLAPVVQELAPIPLAASGRYVAIKFTEKIEAALKPYAVAEAELIARIEVPGSRKANGKNVTFNVKPECQEEWATERAKMLAEPVVLTGVRALTRAELGDALISIAADRTLVECGLLEPVAEPA